MMQETLVIFRYNVQRMHCAFLFCIVSFHIRNSPSWVPFDWKRISLLFSSISSFFLLALWQPFFLSLLFRFFRTFAANSHCTRSTRSMQKDSLSCAIFFPSFPQHTALLTPYFSSLSFPLLSPLVPSCSLLFRPKTHKKEGIAASVMSIYHGHDFHIQSPPQPRSLNAFHFG